MSSNRLVESENKSLPDNMGNSHGSIINSHTKVINWLTITPHYHKISKCIQIPTNLQRHYQRKLIASQHNLKKKLYSFANCSGYAR